MDEYVGGIKRLDASNWLQPDETSTRFAFRTADGIAPARGEDWSETFLRPQLGSDCPEEVRRAYEAARGTLLYGYFFYPLYAEGIRSILGVADYSTTVRARQLGVSARRARSFASRIDALIEAEAIPTERGAWWHTVRKLRSEHVHPATSIIEMPGSAAGLLGRLTARLNELFVDGLDRA